MEHSGETDDNLGKYVTFKITPAMERRLQAVAQRDNNGISATIRRLLASALSREEAA